MKRKILSAILCATMILASLPMVFGAAAVEYTDKIDISSADPATDASDAVYEITDASDLAAFASLCVEANDYLAGKTVILAGNVTIPDGFTTLANFKGTFDGQGNTISGLKTAMFTNITSATVKNVIINAEKTGVADSELDKSNASSHKFYFGFIAVNMSGTTSFNNITANVNFSVDNSSSAYHIETLGMLVGKSASGGDYEFVDCVMNGSITVKGGSKNAIIGGIIGASNATTDFTRCVNNMVIDVTGTSGGNKVGGFASCLNGYGVYTFDYCVNNANISAACLAGGFAADDRGELIVTNSCNLGNITSNSTANINSYAGGFAGQVYKSNSTGTANISNSANAGVITSNNTNANKCRAGGIIGQSAVTTMENVANYGNVISPYVVGGLIGGYGATTGTFTNCLSTATLSAPDGKDVNSYYCRGLLGMSSNKNNTTNTFITFEDTYYVKNGTGNTRAVGVNPGLSTNVTDKTQVLVGNYKIIVNGVENTFIANEKITGDTWGQSSNWTIHELYNNFFIPLTRVEASKIQGAQATNTLKAFDIGKTWLATAEYPVPAVLADVLMGEAETPAAVGMIYEGVQYTAVDSNKFAVRFVATVDKLDYVLVGFEVVRIEMGTAPAKLNKTTNEVYETLYGYDAAGDKHEYTSETFGSADKYLAAISVEEIPADKTVTFVVKPIVSYTDGTMAYGTAYAAVFTNGALTLQYQF